jgi:ABC-2 type transport system permease protein
MSGGALRRLRGLLRKEFVQIWRDPSAIAIAFLVPALLLLLCGYGISLDAADVPLAVATERPTALAESFAGAFAQSSYFAPRRFLAAQDAERMMRAREAQGFLWLPSDFARRADSSGKSPIGVIVNGVDANNARIIEGYVQQAWIGWLAAQARQAGRPSPTLIEVEPQMRFNAAAISRDFIVPGLIAVIMTLTGAMLTALVVAREWERGTMEALLVTRVTIREIMFAKLVPYFVLGMGGMAASVAIAMGLFGVPLRGSLLALTGASALFMLAALGMGLFISTFARSQFVACQVAILATFLPALILSGLIFDINSMPLAIQIVTNLVAARFFVAILQTDFLAGDVWSVILPNAAALVVMAAAFLGAARALARKRLD